MQQIRIDREKKVERKSHQCLIALNKRLKMKIKRKKTTKKISKNSSERTKSTKLRTIESYTHRERETVK